MTKQILPAAKISRLERAQRLAFLQPHEKSRPIYASKLRFSTTVSPTLPPLPSLISPLSFEPPLTPLTLQQSDTTTSFSCTVEKKSLTPSLSSGQPRFQRKQSRAKRATTRVPGDVEICPPRPPFAKWRCHICGKRYAIGVTRRCLKDGHSLCFPVLVNKTQLNSKQKQDKASVGNDKVAEEEGRNEKAKAIIAQRRKIKERNRLSMKANMVTRRCAVKFDFDGWSKFGSWRRRGNAGLGLSCENGCDWPGECKERKRRAAARMKGN